MTCTDLEIIELSVQSHYVEKFIHQSMHAVPIAASYTIANDCISDILTMS